MIQLIDLIKKYPNVSPDILRLYKPAEKFIMFNDGDKDLHPIKVDLPECPEIHTIKNFGLHPRDQKFKPPEIPKKLRALTKKIEILDDIWIELQKNQHFYKEEILFIKKQWYFMLNGYWVFINGVPTYLDGWHYFYCSWWNIDVGLPKYRSRDRKYFIFTRHTYTTTIALYKYKVPYKDDFKYFSTKDNAVQFCKELDIKYEEIIKGEFIVDFKKRTLFGPIYLKFRREGATYKAECVDYCLGIIHKNARIGIQSMTDEDAKDVFRVKLIYPWKKVPFFFKPNYEGSTDPKSELSCNPAPKRLSNRGSLISSATGLQTIFDFAIADGAGYDGKKLLAHHHDEVGKCNYPLNVIKITQVTRECLSVNMGQNILGLGQKTSTVGEMDEGFGGDVVKELCEMSFYDERNENGQTLSGFVVLFIPSEDGIVIDEFGNSVIEDPDKTLIGEEGQIITKGGRSIVNSTNKGLLQAGKFEELAMNKRQFPNCFAECFSVAGGTSKLPVGLIELRLEELAFNNPTKVRGNFYWVDGKFGGNVEFSPDPLGKWYKSLNLEQGWKNSRMWNNQLESWVPTYKTRITLGIDPFKQDDTKGSRRSEGAGAVHYKRDFALDPDPDYKNWKFSDRFVCTYSYRAFDREEFYEDMLMTAIHFSCGVFPEINIPDIYMWFIKKGYAEYLIYKIDFETGKESKTPGAVTANNSYKAQMFSDYSTHLIRNCHREVHDELLMQCKKIAGPKETKKYDLFTAGGWALIGSKVFADDINTIDNPVEISKYFRKYKY